MSQKRKNGRLVAIKSCRGIDQFAIQENIKENRTYRNYADTSVYKQRRPFG